jgi:hypothetical protein
MCEQSWSCNRLAEAAGSSKTRVAQPCRVAGRADNIDERRSCSTGERTCVTTLESLQEGDEREMPVQVPRAVVLICESAAADAPAVGSECAGYVVVACFTCADRVPSEPMLRELAQVAEVLDVDEALLVGAGGVAGQEPSGVIPLPRDVNGSGGRRTQL